MSDARIGRKDLQRIASGLSDRDRAIIGFLRQHRFATTILLRRRFFTTHASQSAATRACVRVLGRLLARRVLTRLERRIGGVRHGSASFIWCLDSVGERLTRTRGSPRRRAHEPSFPFLAHTLAVTEINVRLHEAAAAGAFRVSTVQVETEAWREFVAPSGAKSILKPDLMVTVSSDAYDDHWYLEVDLGTESMPVLLRKCRAYEAYRRTGRAQAEHGVFPRVLWILADTGRVARIQTAIVASPDLPDRLFTCVTTDMVIGTLREPPSA